MDLDVDVLGLGHHEDAGRGRVNTTLRFRHRNPLHAMNPAFEFQQGIRGLAGLGRPLGLHGQGDGLVAAQRRLGGVEDLGAPAVLFGEPGVHPQEVAGEQRRLLTALATLDLDDDVLAVGRVPGHEQVLEPLGEHGQARLEGLDLVGEGGIVGGELAGSLEVVADLLPLAVGAQHSGQLGVPLADLLGLRRVGVHGRIDHPLLERGMLIDERLDGFEHDAPPWAGLWWM